MSDYYDDDDVDMQSLLIGIGMVAAAVGFILVSFTEAKAR
jgi:hypothetical protein